MSKLLTFISDTHNQHDKITINPCYLLIHTGDAANNGKLGELAPFINWLARQPACYKVWVPGNHDKYSFKRNHKLMRQLCDERGIRVLLHEETEIPGIGKFYGAPLLNKDPYPRLPTETDIFLTHEPPYGVLDKVGRCPRPHEDPTGHIGNRELLKVKAKVHAFGHIHEARGTHWDGEKFFINSSMCCREDGLLKHSPIVLDWDIVSSMF